MKKILIFRNRDFLLLWASQLFSLAGSRMYQIAILWWLISKASADEGQTVGLFMVMTALPAVLLVKWVGNIIDSNPSKKILMLNDSLGIIAAIGMALAYKLDILSTTLIMVATLLFALFYSFIGPTLNRAIPELVGEEDLDSAVTFMSSTETLANFLGAVLGAYLIELMGVYWIIILNGLTYVVSVFCDYHIKFKNSHQKVSEENDDKKMPQESGLAILKDLPIIKKVLFGFGVVNFFGTPLVVMLPLYTKIILHGSAKMLGLFEACIWLGFIAGTFSSKFLGFKDRSMLLVSFALLAFGFSLGAPAFFINEWAFGFFLFTACLSLGAMNVRMITLFQKTISNDKKGRFFALLQGICSFAVPLGHMTFGQLATSASIPQALMIQMGGVVAVSLFYFTLAGLNDQELTSNPGIPKTKEFAL